MKKRLSKNLKELRTAYKLTQTEAGKCVGVSQKAWASYEEGRAEPKLKTMLAIAQKFGLKVDDILTKIVKMDKEWAKMVDLLEKNYGDRPAPPIFDHQLPAIEKAVVEHLTNHPMRRKSPK